MLVLSRKSGERILIGPDIEIKIIEVNGGRVRIGISAPREIAVKRAELGDKVSSNGRTPS